MAVRGNRQDMRYSHTRDVIVDDSVLTTINISLGGICIKTTTVLQERSVPVSMTPYCGVLKSLAFSKTLCALAAGRPSTRNSFKILKLVVAVRLYFCYHMSSGLGG